MEQVDPNVGDQEAVHTEEWYFNFPEIRAAGKAELDRLEQRIQQKLNWKPVACTTKRDLGLAR